MAVSSNSEVTVINHGQEVRAGRADCYLELHVCRSV